MIRFSKDYSELNNPDLETYDNQDKIHRPRDVSQVRMKDVGRKNNRSLWEREVGQGLWVRCEQVRTVVEEISCG